MRKIVTDDFLNFEENLLHETLFENGYPTNFIKKYSKRRSRSEIQATVPRKNVYIKLPYKGDDVTILMKRRLNAVIKRTFYSAKLVYSEETNTVPQCSKKDPVAMTAKTNVIYEFTCTCGCKYDGRTSRQLSLRINEHVPRWLSTTKNGIPHSSITKHLLDTGHIIQKEKAFRIVYQARNMNDLRIAEAVTIRIKKPILCVQKQMVMSLALPW